MTVWNYVAWILSPTIALALALAPVVLIISSWERKRERLQRRSPLTKDLLRPPGHSLHDKIEKATDQFVFSAFMCAAVPLVVYAAVTSFTYFGGAKENAPSPIVMAILTLVALVILARRMVVALEERRTHVMGLFGELATGEELNQLMIDDCRVFHDVPGRWGNIDHVIVAPTGVFSVETKVREKREEEDRNWEVIVDYTRGKLKFPGWEEDIPTEQAQWQAKELSEWLSKAVGERVKVSPIIALPGWFIKDKIGSRTVPVMIPTNPQAFFLKQTGDQLTPQQIERIAYQLDCKCRDVEPPNRDKPAE